jgi:PAS domain S-box-containing protein
MKFTPVLFLISLLLFSAGSCPAGALQAETAALEPVTLQLKWTHGFQFAGFYAADIKGFYRDEGLDVTIRQQTTHHHFFETLVAGGTDYCLANGSGVVVGYLQGKPIQVLAVIFQHSPNVLLSRRDSGIRSPADLVGRRVMLGDSINDVELKAMMLHEGIDPGRIEKVFQSRNIDDLVSGRVDAMATYLTTGPFELSRRGVEPAVLKPINYGVDFYGDTLVALKKTTVDHPGRTKAFVRASLRGWQYAFEHPDELIDYILTLPGVRERGVDAESLRYEADVIRDLTQPQLVEPGHVNPGRFRHMADTLARLGLIKPGFNLEGMFFSPREEATPRWLFVLAGVIAGALVIGLVTWLINRRLAALVEARTSEYKASEQRFHDLVNLLPEMIWEADASGRLVFFNPAGLKLLGYDEEDLAKGLLPLQLIAPEDRERARKNMEEIARGKPGRLNEYSLLARDGSRIPVLIRSARVVSRGKVTGMRGIIIDVSERKQLEEQLRQAQKMEAIGTMAGGIAHDFNNILTAILGYIELAAMHVEVNSRARADLDHARKGALRARDLVAQILSFSRKSEKKVTLLDPAEVVTEAVSLLRSTTPSSIEIQLNVRSRSKVMADRTQLHQVVMNICTNAIQAMDNDKGVLTLSLWDEWLDAGESWTGDAGESGLYVCLQIHDTGRGIERDVLGRIFDPYFTTKEQGKGTGLGLSVVHGIVQEYQGRIKVFSEPGQGTTFLIYLPAATEEDSEEDGFAPALYDVASPADRGKGERILVVDDEEELVSLLVDFLVQSGYEAVGCVSGSEALDYFSQSRGAVDLVLADMTMPGMSGLELSRELLARQPELPIILMTGYSAQVDRRAAEEAGIREFLAKPLEMQALLKIVRNLLGRDGGDKDDRG